MAVGRVHGFSIATKCATLDELIEKFRDRVDEQSILVNTVESRDIGTECAFAILLADKKVALAGTCTVMDVFTDANNTFKRPGMRLAIKRLGPESEGVFARLARTPRATPFPETRTPGSAYILPANPFMNLTDASLEGFVDCKIVEVLDRPLERAPAAFPSGTHDELETVPANADAPEPALRPSASRFAVPTHVEPMRSEPLALPPPPPARPTATLPVPYESTELPKLDVGVAVDNSRPNTYVPLVPRRLRRKLLLAIVLVPLLGAAAVVLYMQLAATAMAAAPAMPATVAVVDDDPTHARVTVEAPPAEVAATVPARRQPLHLVLVKSYPNAARVSVGDRTFGTTPTYVKVPANTPVDVNIARPGFKPVTYKLTSKKRTDRVFVRLQRAAKRRK